jgi:hypothetical protein
MRDMPRPFAAFMPGWTFFAFPVAAILLAVFVLHWPWWGDVLAPIGVLAVVGFIGNRFDAFRLKAWMKHHPELTKKEPPA